MAEKFEYLEGALGKQVKHKMMGIGTITEVNKTSGVLTVRFRNSTIRLQFPNSFDDGTLNFIVPDAEKKPSNAPTKQSVYKSSAADSWESDEEDVSWVNPRKAAPVKPEPQNASKDRSFRTREEASRNVTVRSKSRDINNPFDDWDDDLARTCNNCKEFRRGDCAGLRNAKTCAEFNPIPRISKAEMYTWPTQGDALNFKLGKK